jgi:LPS-assembly protein
VLLAIIGGLAWRAEAQPPVDSPLGPRLFAPAPKAADAAVLYMQADQLFYDANTNRVISSGNVELYFNSYILTADVVVYEKDSKKLIAAGQAQLKDPNGAVTRADRMELSADFAEGFGAYLGLEKAAPAPP